MAQLPQGRPKTGKFADIPQSEAAELLNVSERSVRSARAVLEHAKPEVIAASDRGVLAVGMAAKLSRKEPEFQRAVVDKLESGQAKKPMDAVRMNQRLL